MNLCQWVAVTALIPSLSACIETIDSDQVAETAIYQTYEVTYIEGTQQLKASASFNVGGVWGTSVRLRQPSQILFNDSPLTEKTFIGTTYEGTWSTPYSSGPHRWTWIDRDGLSHLNQISITPAQIANPPSSMSRTGSLTLTISGPPLTQQDSLSAWTLQSKDSSGSALYETLRAEIIDGQRLRISLRNPTELSTGAATLYLQRSRSASLQTIPAQKGTVTGGYRLAPIQIEITP
ncbi:MAG: hypothetical protein RJB38_1224 [Pseudomonadota bacterium]